MPPTCRSQDSAECWNCERPLDYPREIQLETPSGATATYTVCSSCFQTAYLAFANEAPELSVRQQPASRVLVVEDDPEMRGLLESVLLTEGYQVNSASNGAEALEKARQEAPDAIVLDLRMPVMDGQEFLQAWRQSAPEATVPVIAISGHANGVTAEELGVSSILAKPFEHTALLGAIAAVFDASSAAPQ